MTECERNISFAFSHLLLIISLLILSGCIRLQGGAGYFYQGSGDSEPKSGSVVLDTDDIIHPNKAPGSITA